MSGPNWRQQQVPSAPGKEISDQVSGKDLADAQKEAFVFAMDKLFDYMVDKLKENRLLSDFEVLRPDIEKEMPAVGGRRRWLRSGS